MSRAITKYIIVDDVNLRHRPYPRRARRQAVLLNRDINRLFGGPARRRSFLLKNNLREILFRKTSRRLCDSDVADLIALLTDFGLRDHYVGRLKGVILGIRPEATLVDISHDLPPHDVLPAPSSWRPPIGTFPSGTIFVVVVDPGVGSARRGIAAEAGE